MRVGGDDALNSGCLNGLDVVVTQGHEEHFFAKAAHFVATVFFVGSKDSEILSDMIENPRRCASNRLHPVVVGGNAVDEIQGVRTIVPVQNLHATGLLELFGFDPIGFFLLHLAVGITAALQRLERFLQGLGHISVVDHAAAQIDDLVDVLRQQRAFFFTRATSCA